MMKCQSENRNGSIVITLEGEVDLESSPQFRDALMTAFGRGAGTVAVQLAAVQYMDSSGVAVLVEGIQESRRRKVGYVLVAASEPVRGILDLAKLTSYFEFREAI